MRILVLLFAVFFTATCHARVFYDDGPYEKGLHAYEKKNWAVAANELSLFLRCYPWTTFSPEARYMTGVAYFHLGEYDLANRFFSEYLKENANPCHFEEVVRYKFCIAMKFQEGEGKRFFGVRKMPKWLSAEQDAIDIFEEVATIFPNDEMAAHAIYNKGCILLSRGCFKESIGEFQMVIRRFPRTEMAGASFEAISIAYLGEARVQPNNPDLLCLAMINMKKFKAAFPSDERICKIEKHYHCMEDLYAGGFYEMGQFYERTEHPRAAWIYYMTTIKEFPNTRFAACAKERVRQICL